MTTPTHVEHYGHLKCLIMRRDTEEVAARVVVDRFPVEEADEGGYVVDFDGPNADMTMHGMSVPEVLHDVADALCWYAIRALAEGVPFPVYAGVSFQVNQKVLQDKLTESDNLESMYHWPAELVTA